MLFFKLFPFLKDRSLIKGIIKLFQFLLFPKYHIIDLFRKISDKVIPGRFLLFLVLEEQESEQNMILPFTREFLTEKLRMIIEYSRN